MKVLKVLTHPLIRLILIIVLISLMFVPANAASTPTYCMPKGMDYTMNTNYVLKSGVYYTATFLIVKGTDGSWKPPKLFDTVTVGITDPTGKKYFTQGMSAVVGKEWPVTFKSTKGGSVGLYMKNKTNAQVCLKLTIR